MRGYQIVNIKEKVIKKLAPKFYNISQYYQDAFHRQRNEIIKLNSKINEQEKIITCINNILERQDEILNIIDNDIVVFKEGGDDIVVAKYANPYNHNYQCKILCSWNIENKRIYIQDIYSPTTNEGFGSIAMEELFRNARKIGIETITGKIYLKSPSDNDYQEHKERLLHFYQKHGFEIIDGRIKKKLNN